MTAEVKTWVLTEIVTEWRRLTGLSQTTDISDSDVKKRLNDYYCNHFPNDAQVAEFDSFVEQAVSATDSGEYTLDIGIDRLDDPVTIDGDEIKLYRDEEKFFSEYPSDEQYVTDPTLAIGSSDTAKVKHSAFDYRIQDYSYSKASSEVALTGSAIPQGKYGAWSLKIDEDGTITVAAADDNATGYDTPRLAIEGLDKSDSDSCFMGYVTVTKSDGAFTPVTTALDATNVTDTYTDGKFEGRNTPEALLLYGTKLYVRPKANDIYEIKVLTIADRPAALEDTGAPADVKWGPAIACNDAVLYLLSIGDEERAGKIIKSSQYYMGSIKSDKIKRLLGGRAERSY